MREIIKHSSGKTIAYQQHVSDYRETITDPAGSLLGWYNPETDKTHDRTGNVISNSGDVRASLIPPAE